MDLRSEFTDIVSNISNEEMTNILEKSRKRKLELLSRKKNRDKAKMSEAGSRIQREIISNMENSFSDEGDLNRHSNLRP